MGSWQVVALEIHALQTCKEFSCVLQLPRLHHVTQQGATATHKGWFKGHLRSYPCGVLGPHCGIQRHFKEQSALRACAQKKRYVCNDFLTSRNTDATHLNELIAGRYPMIICAMPVHDSPHAAGRRLFTNLQMDHKDIPQAENCAATHIKSRHGPLKRLSRCPTPRVRKSAKEKGNLASLPPISTSPTIFKKSHPQLKRH